MAGAATAPVLNALDGEDLSGMDDDGSYPGAMNGKYRFDQLIKTMIARIEYNNTRSTSGRLHIFCFGNVTSLKCCGGSVPTAFATRLARRHLRSLQPDGLMLHLEQTREISTDAEIPAMCKHQQAQLWLHDCLRVPLLLPREQCQAGGTPRDVL